MINRLEQMVNKNGTAIEESLQRSKIAWEKFVNYRDEIKEVEEDIKELQKIVRKQHEDRCKMNKYVYVLVLIIVINLFINMAIWIKLVI